MVDKINITFLGTGCAIPTKRRNHQSTLIQYKSENILIDCGEGTQRQMRIAGVNPCSITRLLITHWHGDHTLGIAGLLQTLALNGYNKKLEIYGPKGTKQFMELYLSLFVNQGQIKIEVHEVSSNILVNEEDFLIETREMKHNALCFAYSFIVKERLRLDKTKLKKLKIPNGPLIGELKKGKTIAFNKKKINGKSLLYKEEMKKVTIIPDTSMNLNSIELAKNSDLLISESTFSEKEEENATATFHLTSKQAATIAKKSNSKKLILTHFSQRFEKDPSILLKEAKTIFKNTILAEDFLHLEI